MFFYDFHSEKRIKWINIQEHPIGKAVTEYGFKAYCSLLEYWVEPNGSSESSDFWMLPYYTDCLHTGDGSEQQAGHEAHRHTG